RRREAAGGDRPGAGEGADLPVRRRADQRPRLGKRPGGDRAVAAGGARARGGGGGGQARPAAEPARRPGFSPGGTPADRPARGAAARPDADPEAGRARTTLPLSSLARGVGGLSLSARPHRPSAFTSARSAAWRLG